MARGVLIGDNREVGRGAGKAQVVEESRILLGFGLGTKQGLARLGELFAANSRAYINHTRPFSPLERPDLTHRAEAMEAASPGQAGRLLTSYIFYIPAGSTLDATRHFENISLAEAYDLILSEFRGSQCAVVTVGEFSSVHWHAFQRPPIYGEPGAHPDGSLKPEYLLEGDWKNTLAISFGYVHRTINLPGEHSIVYTGRDHTHLLRLEAARLEEVLGAEWSSATARPFPLQERLGSLRPYPERQNPVHVYPRSRVRRAVAGIFELEEVA